MDPRKEAALELYKRGELSPNQKSALEELIRRGEFDDEVAEGYEGLKDALDADAEKRAMDTSGFKTNRQVMMDELTEDIGPIQSFFIGMGEGLTTIGRGVGLVEPAGDIEKEAISALKERNPLSTGAGQISGEALPFLPTGVATGAIASTPLRVAAVGALGATEGGLIESGRERDPLKGASIGGAVGIGAEMMFPIIGKLGRKIFQRTFKRVPRGAMLDMSGRPTVELQEALSQAGISFDELGDMAQEFIGKQMPGADPSQVATAARFKEADVPFTKGEITKGYKQLATEQRLLESAEDASAEPLRQFKLKQSESIKANLRSNFAFDVNPEETGELIQQALTGRKKLLRTQKNELYKKAADSAKGGASGGKIKGPIIIANEKVYRGTTHGDAVNKAMDAGDIVRDKDGYLIDTNGNDLARTGAVDLFETADGRFIDRFEASSEFNITSAEDLNKSIPIFTDSITDAVPDAKVLRRLGRIKGSQVEGLNDLLVEFGVATDDIAVEKFLKEGGEIEGLNISNFEEFRQSLNALQKADQTGATSVAIGPIKEALDMEIDELAATLTGKGFPAETITAMKEARKTVRQLKTEFSPQAITGRLIDAKRDGVTPIIEASKVYDKIAARNSPIEETRRIVTSLNKAGEKGREGLASLQTSIMLDLIDAGFGTESRKISGKKVFNPIAFKNRMKNIGDGKLSAIFANNKQSLDKLKNIDKIASDIIPPSGTQPKGSAAVILDLMDKLGIMTLSAKIPGGAIILGAGRKLGQPIKTGIDIRKALKAKPDIEKLKSLFDQDFPGLASAFAVAAEIEGEETK